jgi:hypothetical protein
MSSIKIVDAGNISDVNGPIVQIGVGCDYQYYFKTDIAAFISGCGSKLTIVRKSDSRFIILLELYKTVYNGNTEAFFASAAELKAWVELYLPPSPAVLPNQVQTYAELVDMLPVVRDTFVTVVNDEENGTGNNDNYLYLLHTSGVITWIAAQTIN